MARIGEQACAIICKVLHCMTIQLTEDEELKFYELIIINHKDISKVTWQCQQDKLHNLMFLHICIVTWQGYASRLVRLSAKSYSV